MSAFNPIAPRHAASLVDEASLGEAAKVLVDFAAAGLVKGYARLIESVDAAGRTEVRDSRIPRDLWRRIADAGKSDQVLSAAKISLEAGPVEPAVEITGIRFDDKSLQSVIAQHSAAARPIDETSASMPTGRADPVTELEPREIEIPIVAASSSPKVRPALSALPEGAVLVTVNQAMAALGLGRTKVNDLMTKGTLVRVKIDTRTLITTESIRSMLPPY